MYRSVDQCPRKFHLVYEASATREHLSVKAPLPLCVYKPALCVSLSPVMLSTVGSEQVLKQVSSISKGFVYLHEKFASKRKVSFSARVHVSWIVYLGMKM